MYKLWGIEESVCYVKAFKIQITLKCCDDRIIACPYNGFGYRLVFFSACIKMTYPSYIQYKWYYREYLMAWNYAHKVNLKRHAF